MTVATPSVECEALLLALTPLYECEEPELGRGIAASIVAVRATTDSALALMAFGSGAFIYRDSAIVRAAAQVAADRAASELVRVLGFYSLYRTFAAHGSGPDLREFTAQPPTAERCSFITVGTDTGQAVELTPRSATLIASVGEVARVVQQDPNESRGLRSAATCVLGVWRSATGLR